MTVTIPNELESFVQAKLKSGAFDTPEAVVVAALTSWQGEDLFQSMDRSKVDQLLLEAIDSPRMAWNEATVDQVIDSLRKKHATW
ncbi:putative transcriptional regulator, CopG/Arc/MetJ family [Chthoniobacter flavus Ellin428]|uniref:Putative transcriptional regulator, CopG/Arc/MetJ family n=1 Tax=Chthoniobacter flavus Ellin428 TaxID=497964 RepID=B4D3D3_9BACT|nr:hypothetical protein [Chthoniobacter flavus]EDY19244.1 putative transcriptional regulator, CopG/Arc/MetJ family [Chthoniobacter flavus Ellin428]TCO88087.1 Arc/MetJ-type ribon-helix-helix transcriptional regulator [Chthoniobacter flavus]